MTQEEWLCDYIERAFEKVQLGNGRTIHHAQSLENYGNCIEDQLAQWTERTDWRRVQAKTLLDRLDAILFLDAEGFRFYLPALMTIIIKNSDVDEWLVESVISRLNVDSKGTINGMPFRSIFSVHQKAAIVRFLKYVIHHRRAFAPDHDKKILMKIQSCT
jgi:hypothetical protein